jgi:pilus assembly protein CpaC
LMIVTPHLVQPLAADAQLPSLPGEKLRNYDPNFYRMFFLENGNFDKRSGLSQ